MHLMLNRLQTRRALSMFLVARGAQARPSTNLSGVGVRRLVASHVRLREARMRITIVGRRHDRRHFDYIIIAL